jgi:hypothetical protein
VSRLLQRTPVALTRGRRQGHVVLDHLCLACHGLSVLVTARRQATTRTRCSTSAPPATYGWTTPGASGVDLAAIELVFLSHWHFESQRRAAQGACRHRPSTRRGRSLAPGSRRASRSPPSARHHLAHRRDHALPCGRHRTHRPRPATPTARWSAPRASAVSQRYAPSVVGSRYDLAAVLTPRCQPGREQSV